MRNVKELWPSIKAGTWGLEGGPTYLGIMAKIGNVLLETSDDDYQGDTYALIEKNSRYGYLCFGWGSCSGCDALAGCITLMDLQDLCDRLENNVQWFDSKGELRAWLEARDWEATFEWHSGAQEFLPKALAYLACEREVPPSIMC